MNTEDAIALPEEKQSNSTSPKTVIQEIKNSLIRGYGILPIIGAGMSARSGVPAGPDYHAYLFHCIREVCEKRWSPTDFIWPPFSKISTTSSSDQQAWCTSLMGVTGQASGGQNMLCGAEEIYDSDEAKILHQAAGATSDWRLMLLFLSRISVQEISDSNGIAKRKLVSKEVDSEVVDSFFRNLTQDKKPNVAHMLLAHLADVLRIKPIITTNFDNLIELAFNTLDMPIESFHVHRNSRFPDSLAVKSQRSIIKIHGGRYGMRADLSLDSLPEEPDVRRFLDYISMPTDIGPQQHRAHPQAGHQRNILVMGVSGKERRTISLLCRALLRFDSSESAQPSDARSHERLTVYWICYTREEESVVRNSFEQILRETTTNTDFEEIYNGRGASDATKRNTINIINEQIQDILKTDLRIVASNDLGLFLLDLYQHIFLCLPPGGVPFNAKWKVPIPSLDVSLEKKSKYQNALQELLNELETKIAAKNVSPGLKNVHKFQFDKKMNISVFSKKFDKLAKQRNNLFKHPINFLDKSNKFTSTKNFFSIFSKNNECIWLEIKSTFDICDFSEEILQRIADLSKTKIDSINFNQQKIKNLLKKHIIGTEYSEELAMAFTKVACTLCKPVYLFVDTTQYPAGDDPTKPADHNWTEEKRLQLLCLLDWLCELNKSNENIKINTIIVSDEVNRVSTPREQAPILSSCSPDITPHPIFISGSSDITPLIADCFTSLAGGRPCIWLDLVETFDISAFAASVIEAIANLSGSDFNPVYLDLNDFQKAYKDNKIDKYLDNRLGLQLVKVTSAVRRPVVIFVNAADYPTFRERQGGKNSPYWTEEKRLYCLLFLTWLSRFGKSNSNVNVVVVSPDNDGLARKFSGELQQYNILIKNESVKENYDIWDTPQEVVNNFYTSLHEKPLSIEYRRFLTGLTLFREPSYRSVLHSWGLIKTQEFHNIDRNIRGALENQEDNDEQRFAAAAFFVRDLEKQGVVRTQEGHRVHVSRQMRKLLKTKLMHFTEPEDITEQKKIEAACHQGIADWHVKLYRSCGDIEALITSIYHRLKCISAAHKYTDNDETRFIKNSILEIRSTLDIISPIIIVSSRLSACLNLWNENTFFCKKIIEQLSRSNKNSTLKTEDRKSFVRRLKLIHEQFDVLINYYNTEIKGQPIYLDSPQFHENFNGEDNNDVKTSTGQKKSNNKEEMTADISQLRQYITIRDYENAKEEAKALFNKLKAIDTIYETVEKAEINTHSSVAKARDNARVKAREWTVKKNPSKDDLQHMIKLLFRYQMLKLHEAEHVRHDFELRESRGEDYIPLGKANFPMHLLRQAEMIYICSTEIMRYIDDVKFLQVENALLRTNTGTVLSWQNRPSEANRRYNEAYGYFNHAEHRPQIVMHFATVDLRRTEHFLALYSSLNNKEPTAKEREALTQRKFACLYDACSSVERAAYKAHGAAVQARWHAWLHEIELTICWRIVGVDMTQEFAHCRRREGLHEWLENSLLAGMKLANEDIHRLARYVFLIQNIKEILVNKQPNYPLNEIEKKILSVCNEHIRPLAKQFQQCYVNCKKYSDPFIRDVFYIPGLEDYFRADELPFIEKTFDTQK